MKIMRFTMSQDGKTGKLAITGACGPECQQLAKPIEDRLGIVTSDEPTEEFFGQQPPEVTTVATTVSEEQ